MILIVSDKHDEHANVVESKLNKKGVPFFRLNVDVESLILTQITFNNDMWTIKQGHKNINSDDISTIWFRRAFVELLLEEKENRDVDFLIWKNEWNKVLLGFYLSLSNKPALCPLKQSYAVENKFWQYVVANEIGFKIPQFITSNNKEELLEFSSLYSENVVLKLQAQDFYKVGETHQGLYVNKIKNSDLQEFKDTGENPITLQHYINKSFEVRYTVVGDKHFCCKIESQKSDQTKTDWRRYDIPNTPHYAYEAPIEIRDKIDALMEKLDINFGALDFIVDENNEWFFLEINSMGQWLWIEDLTDLDISDSICDWLINHI